MSGHSQDTHTSNAHTYNALTLAILKKVNIQNVKSH